MGRRVFTNLVEESDDRPGEHQSTSLKTPLISSLEAITVEVENPPVTYVDLTAPDSSPLIHLTPDISKLNREDLAGKMKLIFKNSSTSSPQKLYSNREFKKLNRSDGHPQRITISGYL